MAVDQKLVDDEEIIDNLSDIDSETSSLFDDVEGNDPYSDSEAGSDVEDEQVGNPELVSHPVAQEGLLGAVNFELGRWGWPGVVNADDLARVLANLSAQRVTLSKDSRGAGRQVAEAFVSGTIARVVGGGGEVLAWRGDSGDTDGTGILDLGDRQLRGVRVGDFYKLDGLNLYVGVDAVRHGTPKGKQELAEQLRQFLGDGLTLYRGVPAWHPSWREIRNGAVLPLDG
ncbi:hypothetical protein ABZX92_45815, partial [Lentzea sp. NPDC006480]|uniref:hypothetical protein n=1 Tax=Lentzea sp. NPDC006480 TaxID=3157176 RepID=UPI0033A4FEBF